MPASLTTPGRRSGPRRRGRDGGRYGEGRRRRPRPAVSGTGPRKLVLLDLLADARTTGHTGSKRLYSERSAPAGGAVRRVLLLNVTYEPLTTVGLRRAVCLVLGGKAEVVHDDLAGAVLHAASIALAMPSVIRLSRYVRVPYRNRVPLTRAALMRRDNYRCAYCGRRAETIA